MSWCTRTDLGKKLTMMRTNTYWMKAKGKKNRIPSKHTVLALCVTLYSNTRFVCLFLIGGVTMVEWSEIQCFWLWRWRKEPWAKNAGNYLKAEKQKEMGVSPRVSKKSTTCHFSPWFLAQWELWQASNWQQQQKTNTPTWHPPYVKCWNAFSHSLSPTIITIL